MHTRRLRRAGHLASSPDATSPESSPRQDSKAIEEFNTAPSSPPPPQEHFLLAETQFAVGRRADVWIAYKQPDFDTYERLEELQGRYIPELVEVIRNREVFVYASQQQDLNIRVLHEDWANEYIPATGLVLSHAGVSLQLLQNLASGNKVVAMQARTRLPQGYLTELATHFAARQITTASAAADDIAYLVDKALAAIHRKYIVHGSVVARNICIRATERGSVGAFFVDFERSRQYQEVHRECYSREYSEQLMRQQSSQNRLFAREREGAKTFTIDAITALWPCLIPELSQVPSRNTASP